MRRGRQWQQWWPSCSNYQRHWGEKEESRASPYTEFRVCDHKKRESASWCSRYEHWFTKVAKSGTGRLHWRVLFLSKLDALFVSDTLLRLVTRTLPQSWSATQYRWDKLPLMMQVTMSLLNLFQACLTYQRHPLHWQIISDHAVSTTQGI